MSSMMAASAPKAGIDIFERILDAPGGLVVLDGADGATLIGQFRAIARHSGQAVYLWQPGGGLSSLRDAHAHVPDCERLGNALRYVLQSMHFGIYLLSELELPLSAMDATLLRQIGRAPAGHVRRVVLIGAPASLVEYLGPAAVVVDARTDLSRRRRLRDGHWVV